MALLELVTLLPPGAPSQTRLARHGRRLVVLRELKPGTTCFTPQGSAPRVATLEEVGELQGKRHALFPFVPGVTLRDVVRTFESVGKLVPLAFSGAVVLQAARALAALSPPRMHGGLSDFALQVGFDGEVWVLDFGAPRVSRFRAPGRPGPAADVFSLAAVLHSTLTGFEGSYGATVAAPASSSHPEATPALDDVLARALSHSPESRPRDLGAFADELEPVLGAHFSAAELGSVVTSLFRERLALLETVGGLSPAAVELGEGEDPLTDAHAVPIGRPRARIPEATQPGSVADGGGTSPGAQLSWLPEAVAADDVIEVDLGADGTQSHPAMPRPKEESTSPGVPLPGAPPPPVRITASAAMVGVGLMPSAAEATEAGVLGPDGSFMPPSDATQAGQPPPQAHASPRASAAPRPSGPRVATPPPRPSAPPVREAARASGPRASGAHLRPPPAVEARAEDTVPRPAAGLAEGPHDVIEAEAEAPPELGDEAIEVASTALRPRPPEALPRHTTTHERLRAAGQERVPTPPLGSPAVDVGDDAVGLGDEVDAPPTAIRPRVPAAPPPAITTAQTVQRLKAVGRAPTDDGEAAAPGKRGRGLIAVLLLLVAGLGAVAAMKQGRLPAPEPLAGWLGLAAALDAGAPPPEEDEAAADGGEEGELVAVAVSAGAGEVADAGEAPHDAGADDDGGAAFVSGAPPDSGVEPEGDAGVDAGVEVDAGAPTKGPSDEPKPGKKKKRRR